MSWSGVKKQTNNVEIEAWCDKMGIENYTINAKGEIDVDGNVNLVGNDFKELPFKFGTVTGYFTVESCKNLTSLKNCPNYVNRWFACDRNKNLSSLEGCPREVKREFYCSDCKREFTKEEVKSLCKIDGYIRNE